MFCKHCGNELPEAANFCPKCGKTQENDEAVVQTSYQEKEEIYVIPDTDPFKEEKAKKSRSILILSIVGLALSVISGFSLAGLIVSCIAKSKIKAFIMDYDELEGPAKIGNGLSTGGVIAGIVISVITVLYVIFYGTYFALLLGIQ